MSSYMIDINDVTEDVLHAVASEFSEREYVVRDDFSFVTVTIQSSNLKAIQALIKEFDLDVRIYDVESGQFLN